MQSSDAKGNLIQELADAFTEDNTPKKVESRKRFNKSTGTWYASTEFRNQALCLVDDDPDFTKGKVYRCSQVHEDYVKLMDDNGKEIRVHINDSDFSFRINPQKGKDF